MLANGLRLLLGVLLAIGYWPSAELWQPERVSNFIIPLQRIMSTDNIIWYISEELDNGSRDLLQQLMMMHLDGGATNTILTNASGFHISDSTNKKNCLNLVVISGIEDPIVDVHSRYLRGKHSYFTLFILAEPVEDFRVVERFVYRLKMGNFAFSFLNYYTSNGTAEFAGYELYPEYRILNRSNFANEIMEEFGKMRFGGADVLGSPFPVPLGQDVPHIFNYETPNGDLKWRGTSFKIMELFMEYINGTLVRYVESDEDQSAPVNDVINMKDALELVRRKRTPLMAHAYSLFTEDEEIGKSYPLLVVNWCLMVPIFNAVSTYYYPLQPFQTIVWMICAGASILWIAVSVLRAVLLHWAIGSALDGISDVVLQDFCLLLNMNAGKKLATPTAVRILIFCTVFLYGFFVSAVYTSLLGSILTVNLFRAQINTMEELVRANISVLVVDYEMDFLLAIYDSLPEAFLQLLRPVDVATVHHHQTTLNNSFAYLITDERWHILNLQQKYLQQAVFKFTDICFGSHHLAFAMEPDSPVWRSLEYFVYRVHSCGMYQHFEQTVFDYAIHSHLLRRLIDSGEYTSAGLDHLSIVFALIAVLYGFSIFLFLLELLLHYCSGRI